MTIPHRIMEEAIDAYRGGWSTERMSPKKKAAVRRAVAAAFAALPETVEAMPPRLYLGSYESWHACLAFLAREFGSPNEKEAP